MGIPKTIRIKDGYNGKITYYYMEEYDTYDEAIKRAKQIKQDRRKEMKIKYFILEAEDSWFLPVNKFVLYLNKKLRLI